MPPNDPNCHCASIEVVAPAERAFAFMADAMKRNHWALGSMNRRDLGGGLFVGTSLFDGTELYSRLAAYPDLLLVDSSVGTDPAKLRPLIEARIKRGESLGRDRGTCAVTLTIWRAVDVSDEAWALTYHLWKTEVHLIKGAIERGL